MFSLSYTEFSSDLQNYIIILQDSVVVYLFTFTGEFYIFMCFVLLVSHFSFQFESLLLSEKKKQVKNTVHYHYTHIKMTGIFKSDISKFWWRYTVTGGFLGGSHGKESICNVGDLGLIPGLGRSLGVGNSNLLQYSFLENSMDRGTWWATVHAIAKSIQ